jgi:2-polyprenyl-3-methyl-5-hydroxy-6-metoxy-1,4-benzoquinol methylase
MALLGNEYRELYTQYYSAGRGALSVKRDLAAADSYLHIRTLLGCDNPDSIIDVGAGNGSLLERIQHGNLGRRLAAVEISESGIAEIKARQLSRVEEVVLFDGYRIPFPDQSFDLALSIHVLEHVEHERMFLRELQRVGKRLIVEVPLENGLRAAKAIRFGRPNGHINYYTPVTFLNLL